MADHHVCVAHNPGSNLKLASGIAPVPAMRQAGITVGLGTDGASSNNNLDMFEEMRLAALIHKGALLDPFAVTAPEAVSMATEEGAKCLGYSDLGRLEEGALADLILVDRSGFHWQPRFNNTSLLAYSANSMDVDTVIVNGRVLMKNRELLTIDTERLSSEVKRAAGLLFEA
jgi:5-methylthioadenosine/S-adenosylhomocysteine deaminase